MVVMCEYNKLTTVSGTRVTVACLQGSVSAVNEHWINPKQYLHFSLLYSVAILSYSCLEILKWQPSDVLMHPKLFSDSLNKLIQTPNSSPSWFKKRNNENSIIIILFWGLYKASLIKKNEYIIVYLTLRITTSPLSFALKYYHASK